MIKLSRHQVGYVCASTVSPSVGVHPQAHLVPLRVGIEPLTTIGPPVFPEFGHC